MIRSFTLALFAATGCASAPAPETPSGIATCSAAAAQSLVGQLGTPENAAKAMTLTRTKTMRWLRPGMAVTMDYRSDRLNILLDEKDVIAQITCG